MTLSSRSACEFPIRRDSQLQREIDEVTARINRRFEQRTHMRPASQHALLNSIDAMDVNRIADAIKLAQKVSKENPGKIFAEVNQAETEASQAMTRLLAAQQHLTTAVGRLMVDQDREARRNAPEPG